MASITRLTTFRDYYAINKELLAGLTNQMDSTAQAQLVKQVNEKKISADTSITSSRKGFEYLNELFIKRHKKILWNSTKKISYVCAFLVAAVLAGVYLLPEEKTVIKDVYKRQILSIPKCVPFWMKQPILGASKSTAWN